MNDYEQTVEDLDQAITTTETAYNNAVDPEDEARIDDALDILKEVRERVEEKA